jgi:hypothetical protein
MAPPTPLLDSYTLRTPLPQLRNIPTTLLRLPPPLDSRLNCWPNTRPFRLRTTAPLVGCLPDNFLLFLFYSLHLSFQSTQEQRKKKKLFFLFYKTVLR